MINSFKKHIETNFPYLLKSKILIAISGGKDSTVLTHLCNELKLNISLCHCNFKLREKDADDDEIFVKNLAKKLSLEFYSKSFNTEYYANKNKKSIQVTARELRYNYFNELIDKYSFDFVLTAHHLDDNLETFFINFLRGSGLKGLTGIPEINGKYIRPLLRFKRQEINVYCIENDINWREDESNSSNKYLRNKIRHQLIPVLKDIQPEIYNSFTNNISNLKSSEVILNDKIQEVKQQVLSEDKELIKLNLDKLLKIENHQNYLYYLLNDYGFTDFKAIEKILNSSTGKIILSTEYQLTKNRNELIISSLENDNNQSVFYIDEFTAELVNPLKLKLEKVDKMQGFNQDTLYVDKSMLNYPLKLRKWQKGDYFYPFGLNHKQKLSDFFINQKLSLIEKEQVWFLESNNEIVWVVGLRSDNRFKITEKTKNILKISLE